MVQHIQTQLRSDSTGLGYVIRPSHQNRGYATEMLRAVIDALHADGFGTIITGAFTENAASIRVMQKCGMKLLDRQDEVPYRGQLHRCVYYAACAADK